MKLFIILTFVLFCFSCVKNDETTIEIKLSTKGNDISFDQEALQVPIGRKINLIFRNMAEGDSEIDHNVAIIKLGKEEEVLKILNDEEYEFDSEENVFLKKDLLIGFTKILAPQKEAMITFKPEKAGYYTFICLMPGHGNIMSMKGVIKVK